MHRSGGSHTWPQTHPNLPQGKELVSPTKWCQPTAEIVVQGNLHLPYGGEREGAEVIGRNHRQRMEQTVIVLIADRGNSLMNDIYFLMQ